MNPWRGLRGLPREIWILFAATLVNRCGTMVLPFLVLYLTRVLAISVSHAALALTVYGIGALLTMPIAGRLTDRLGALFVMRCSLLLSGFVLFLFPLAHHFGGILAITFVFAILNESVRPPSLALVSDLVEPEQRKQAFALSRLAVNLGMSLGPAIGGILAVYSFRFLFFADGATSILAGLVLIFAWPGTRRTKATEPQWDDPEDLGREIEAEGPALLAAPHPAADLRAFRNRRMLYFLAALIPTQLVFFQLTSTLPVFLVRYLRLPESFYGTVFTLNTLMIVALEVPLNNATAHWSHRRSLTLGALLYAIGFGSFALASGPAGVFAAVAVWTFGEMILMPGSAAYAAEIAPAGRRGEYMGLYTMSFSFAFSVGPWLGAMLLDIHGPQILWGAAFLSGCISTLLMSRIGLKTNHAEGNSALVE
ncbi:MAG TPA: MFS transporter [Candidatus Acidoferrales bacterium]|jgi:MFS family permease|nr:MFS transporter [Candidatus Acidoferrales bacterium]